MEAERRARPLSTLQHALACSVPPPNNFIVATQDSQTNGIHRRHGNRAKPPPLQQASRNGGA